MSFPLHIPFHVYSNCIPIKGNLRSAIYDLQRNDFDYIPNSLFEILILNHYFWLQRNQWYLNLLVLWAQFYALLL